MTTENYIYTDEDKLKAESDFRRSRTEFAEEFAKMTAEDGVPRGHLLAFMDEWHNASIVSGMMDYNLLILMFVETSRFIGMHFHPANNAGLNAHAAMAGTTAFLEATRYTDHLDPDSPEVQTQD